MISEIHLGVSNEVAPLNGSPATPSHVAEPSRPRWGLVAIGFVLSIVTAALIAFAIQLSGDWTGGLEWERDLLRAIPRNVEGSADLLFLTLPWLSSNTVVLPIVALVSLYIWRIRGRGGLALQLLVVDVGTAVLTPLLKGMFARPRPELWEHRGQYAWASYPSGHAIIAVAVFATIAVLAFRERGMRWPAFVLAVLAIISLYSRLYLGVHWPTDVLAGALVGSVWLGFTMAAFSGRRVDVRRGGS